MEPISNLLGDKNKFLPTTPPPMNDDITHNEAIVPSLPAQEPVTVPPVAPEIPPQVPQAADPINVDLMRITLYKMKDQLDIMLHLLEGKSSSATPQQQVPQSSYHARPEAPQQPTAHDKSGTVLEGYFNGEKMISDEGEIFDIPQNYASKSKLVDGDRMKLTITNTGSFLYKQIKPIEKQRIRGELVSGGATGQWMISTPVGQFKVLTAAVTFHRGRVGDEVVLLIPASGHSDWGAIEHIIHKDFS